MNLLSRLPHQLKPEDHYRLHTPTSSRIQYGVDHESYAYQLALDMGSAPSISEMAARGWKMLFCWALSANVNTKFRLVGPWRWDGAQKVMETEIWETITRRRGFFGEFLYQGCVFGANSGYAGHLTLSIMPILLFGTLSSIIYGLTSIWKTVKFLWKLLIVNSSV